MNAPESAERPSVPPGQQVPAQVRFPAALRVGDRIAVTSPSEGVPPSLLPRLEFCLEVLRQKGFEVVTGACMDGSGVVSAPAEERAAEFMSMMLDPTIRAIVPPWGGELGVEVLPHVDFESLQAVEPTWVVGFSDTTALLLPLTTLSGMATLHGQNLLETPYHVPPPLLSWIAVASADRGSTLSQGPSVRHRAHGYDPWELNPVYTEYTLDTEGGWRPLEALPDEFRVRGRLLGGCIESISTLAGTPYGNAARFAETSAPEGLILYLEASDAGALTIARNLWRMRLAGWFDVTTCVLVGRTSAPSEAGFSQEDAVRSALHGLDLPVVMDVDCGHPPPHLALVNGAVAELTISSSAATLVQHIGSTP